MSDRQKPDFQYDVFISYRSADRPWVKDILLKQLEAVGLKVCIDYRDFVPGMPIIRNIRKAMLTSRKTLLILTPAYLDSQWTSFEQLLTQTLDPAGVGLRLIPVMKENCLLPLEIAFLSHINFANPEDERQEWQRLLQVLGKTSEYVPTIEKTHEKGFRIFPKKISSHYQRLIFTGLLTVIISFVFQLSRPQLATVFNRWGLQDYEANRLRNALNDYKLAIFFNPNHLDAHYNLALLYEDSGRLEEAMAEYQWVVATQPNPSSIFSWLRARNNLGRLHLLAGNYEESANQLNRGLNGVGEFEVLVESNDRDLFEQIIYALLKNLGWVRLEQERHSEASGLLRQAIELNGEPAAAYCLYAQVLDARGNEDEALSYWETCLQKANAGNADEDKWIGMARNRLTPQGEIQ